MENEKCYSVWVGGGEINDIELSIQEALDLAYVYLQDEYDDVQIVRN